MHARNGQMKNKHGNGFAAWSGWNSECDLRNAPQEAAPRQRAAAVKRVLEGLLHGRGRSLLILAAVGSGLATGSQMASANEGPAFVQGSAALVARFEDIQEQSTVGITDEELPRDAFIAPGIDPSNYDDGVPALPLPQARIAMSPDDGLESVVKDPVGEDETEGTLLQEVPFDQSYVVAQEYCPPNGHSRSGRLAGLFGAANPRWEFTADALLLWQGNITNRVYYTDPTGNSVLEAAQGQTPLSVGPRFGLMLNLDQERAVELNYFQTSPFRGEQTTPPSDAAYTMNDLAGFDLGGVSGATFETDALIQSFEANWRRGNGGPLTWLVGFRWVEWNDSLSINDTAGQFTDTFNTAAGNDLYGAQLGLDAMLWNRDQAISIDGVAKAGVYYNTAYQQISANDGVARGPLRAAADETSFFGELGITMDTRITHWLSWRLGYSAFWLSGVAEASGQLSSTNLQLPIPPPATINTGGSVLLHGVTTGIEARW
jgi:hypothetical protein